jgi:hypothetical protein
MTAGAGQLRCARAPGRIVCGDVSIRKARAEIAAALDTDPVNIE